MSDFEDIIEPVARKLLGEPNPKHSKGNVWRYGSNGSLSIEVSGARKGTWYDFENAIGGGVLDLVQRVKQIDRRDALAWVKNEIGDIAKRPEMGNGRRVVASYPYHDENGNVLFEQVRLDPKDFRFRRPDGKSGWIWNMKGVTPVPYRLGELQEAIAKGRRIFIVEGEKDVESLLGLGLTGTCNPGGSNKWPEQFKRFFYGADVVIIPDNDAAGQKHKDLVARSLNDVASTLRVLDLPGLPRKGDVSDWIATGGTVEELNRLADLAPPWEGEVANFPFVWLGEEDKGPPFKWLIKGVLPAGGMSLLYGDSGTGKSFLSIDLGLRVACGMSWFDRKMERGGVVYIAAEGGSGLRLRLKAWRDRHQHDGRAPFVLIPCSLDLRDRDGDIGKLIQDIRDHRQKMDDDVSLIVVDTLSRAMAGGDENSPLDMGLFIKNMERIQSEFGSHVLIVHHVGKDGSRGPRGHTSLRAAVDTALEVTRFETDGLCTATITKQKDGQDAAFNYRLWQSVLGLDEDGEEVSSCVIEPAGASKGGAGQPKRLSHQQRIALNALRQVVDDLGQSSPGGQVSDGARVVKIETWRNYVYQSGLADSKEAKKKAFQRAKEALQSKKCVGVWEPWVWLAQ